MPMRAPEISVVDVLASTKRSTSKTRSLPFLDHRGANGMSVACIVLKTVRTERDFRSSTRISALIVSVCFAFCVALTNASDLPSGDQAAS